MTQRTLIGVCGLVFAVALSAPGSEREATAQSPERPNVVVVMTDDQAVSQMRALDSVRERIGGRGVEFTRSYATRPLCCPARATLFTGQYQHNHGILGNGPATGGGYELFDTSNTLPVWLQRAGYRTVHIGKFLNGYGDENPTEVPAGWDEWYGAFGVHRYDYRLNENGEVVGYGNARTEYMTDVLANKAAAAIESSSRPFFLSVGVPDPHTESTTQGRDPRPAPRYEDRYLGARAPRVPSFNERDVSDKPETIQRRRLDSERIRQIDRRYGDQLASLLAVDDLVERLLGRLAEKAELDSTLFIFTSDNGYFSGEHRIRCCKDRLYEPASRVPLYMRGPGVPADVQRSELVGNIDLAPTILDATNVPPGRRQDGVSLLPLAQGDGAAGRDLLLEAANKGSGPSQKGVRDGRWLYVRWETGERELYDLRNDPYQLESRHSDPDLRDRRRALASRLDRLTGCAGEGCAAP